MFSFRKTAPPFEAIRRHEARSETQLKERNRSGQSQFLEGGAYDLEES
jgi:hypothetical protein